MKTKKILFAALALMILFGGASAAFAQSTTTTTTSTQALLQQLQQLQQQIQQLQLQQKTITTSLLTTLSLGSTGEKVQILQALLAADPDIYPEGKITGYFGALTRRAVMNFQKRNGLPQVGNVGPMTLEKLNRKMQDHPLALESSTSTGKRPCAIVPPGHLIAPGWLKKHDGVMPVVPPCQSLPPGIMNHGTSTPGHSTSTQDRDKTAPVISNVTTTVSSTSATITWTTNEPATTQVLYGATTTLGSNTGLNTSLVTSHSQAISGLSTSTIYYFQVRSRDAEGNLGASTQQSFTTTGT